MYVPVWARHVVGWLPIFTFFYAFPVFSGGGVKTVAFAMLSPDKLYQMKYQIYFDV